MKEFYALQEFVICDCGTHAVQVSVFKPENHEESVYLSFWESGHAIGISWRNRIRCIWHIIRTGTPWEDDVVLSREEATRLSTLLTKAVELAKAPEKELEVKPCPSPESIVKP